MAIVPGTHGSLPNPKTPGFYPEGNGLQVRHSTAKGGTLTEAGDKEKLRSRLHVVSPFGQTACITPPNLSGAEWLKHWMSNSSQIRMTREIASEIIGELEKLEIPEAYKLLTEPMQDNTPTIEPFLLALIRRLGPSSGSDQTFESAKANINILNTICEKFKSSPEQFKKIMFFTHWEKDSDYESPFSHLAKALTYWQLGKPAAYSWLIKSKAETREVAGELQALIKRLSQLL